MTSTVAIIDTGVANSASMRSAFERLGVSGSLISDPRPVEEATHVVLPGVGSFESSMTTLSRAGLVEPLRDRIRSERSTLAVCLGLQMLCRGSKESPGVSGLGIIDAEVVRFAPPLPSPQLGWNDVAPDSSRFVEPGVAYFANSLCLRDPPQGWDCAQSNYGGAFVSALRRGRVLACQFHPELSGTWGQDILKHWLKADQSAGKGRVTC